MFSAISATTTAVQVPNFVSSCGILKLMFAMPTPFVNVVLATTRMPLGSYTMIDIGLPGTGSPL